MRHIRPGLGDGHGVEFHRKRAENGIGLLSPKGRGQPHEVTAATVLPIVKLIDRILHVPQPRQPAIPLHSQAHDSQLVAWRPFSTGQAQNCRHSRPPERPSFHHVVDATCQHIAPTYLSMRLALSGTGYRAGRHQSPLRYSAQSRGSAAPPRHRPSTRHAQLSGLSRTFLHGTQLRFLQTARTVAEGIRGDPSARSVRSEIVLPPVNSAHHRRSGRFDCCPPPERRKSRAWTGVRSWPSSQAN